MNSNSSTATTEPPRAARQAALNSVLARLVAGPPPNRARPQQAAHAARPAAQAAEPAVPTPPPAPPPSWLAAPVLKLPIPDSPFAAPTVPAQPEPAPPPAPVETAPAAEVFEVPPLVEPIIEPKPVPDDPAAQIMTEIAAIVARAPRAIPAVVVDLGAVDPVAEPAVAPPPAPAAAPQAVAAEPAVPQAATPQPAAAPARDRAETTRRVAIRRARPRVARPARKNAPASPAKPRSAPTKLADRLGRVGGGSAPQHPRPAAVQPRPAPPPPPPPPPPQQASPPPQQTPPPAAKAPARDRPAMAPAAAAVARLPRGTPAPAAVPETRPLTQNRRLYRRVMLSADLEVAGTPCRLIDLSIGGFAAQGAAKLDPGALVPVTLRMTIDGINIGTEFQARMVYGNGARAAGRFVELTAAQTAFLRYIVTWRGEAIGAVGTTTLLDAITRWPERAFQPHPSTVRPPAGRPGFWSRLIGRIPLLGWRRRE